AVPRGDRGPHRRATSSSNRSAARGRATGGSSSHSFHAADPQRAFAARHRSDQLVVIVIALRRRLGRLAVVDDVTLLEQDALGDLTPARHLAQQELEVHREVLELLPLGVWPDRRGVGSGLERESLLIPADRLALLFERGAEAGEGAGLGGE